MIQFNVTLVKNINIAIYYAAVVTTVMSLLLYIKAFYVQGYLKNNAK